MMTIAVPPTREFDQSIANAFRESMRQLAGGVSIVAAGTDGEFAGITATSVTSLSMEPPTILVCVNRASSLVPFLQRYWHFSVNVLSADQHEIANRFTGRTGFQGADRFGAGEWGTLATGAPVLTDALAKIDCKLEEVIDRHSHLIVLGRVVAAQARGAADPLLYWRGDFVRLPASSSG